MILSRAGEYGIQIALQLAIGDHDGYLPVRTLAEQTGIPFHFLGKICNRLTHSGILGSYKGPNGGVALSRRPEEIKLIQIVEALDGLEGFDRCVLGLDACDDEIPCPLHHSWRGIKTRILAMFSAKTLSELAEELSTGKTRMRLDRMRSVGGSE